MKRISTLVVVCTVLIIGGTLALAWAQDLPSLSGITADDKYPSGCIDCHNHDGDGEDTRLTVSLDKLGHPNVSAMMRLIPQDCSICHKPATPLGSLGEQTHRLHYENPSENAFVTGFNGECLVCHALNSSNGKVITKSGSKNW